MIDLFHQDGIDLSPNYNDCGVMLYDTSGRIALRGSGCGCSAAVLTGYLLNGMREGRWHHILFAGTGALLSPVSTQQKESIPSICHAVAISTSFTN